MADIFEPMLTLRPDLRDAVSERERFHASERAEPLVVRDGVVGRSS
jgi:hypothetical protein